MGGVLLLLTQALLRLTPLALEPLRDGSLAPWQLVLYGAWVGFMAYSEGYRGFQLQFSPRAVRRAFELPVAGTRWHILFGPLYCMSLIGAARKDQMRARVLLVTIVTLILAVRLLPQPWRGIVDGGVVVGLGWGVISTVMLFGKELAKGARRRSTSGVL
jgi:hypothetical protein